MVETIIILPLKRYKTLAVKLLVFFRLLSLLLIFVCLLMLLLYLFVVDVVTILVCCSKSVSRLFIYFSFFFSFYLFLLFVSLNNIIVYGLLIKKEEYGCRFGFAVMGFLIF